MAYVYSWVGQFDGMVPIVLGYNYVMILVCSWLCGIKVSINFSKFSLYLPKLCFSKVCNMFTSLVKREFNHHRWLVITDVIVLGMF